MVVTDLTRFALHALLCILIFTGEVRIWQVVVIEVLFGAAEAFSRPAASGLLPQTVAGGRHTAGHGADEHVQQRRRIRRAGARVRAGPRRRRGWAFALDAATFLLSAGLLSRISPRERGGRAGRHARPSPDSGTPFARDRLRSARAHGCGRRSPRSAQLSSSGSHRGTCSARWSPRPVRPCQRLRLRRGRARRRHHRRIADRPRMAPAAPDAHGDARDHRCGRSRRSSTQPASRWPSSCRRPRSRGWDGAVRRLVADGARGADPCRSALAGHRL